MSILFPRITLELWKLDDAVERFNLVRVYIGRANPEIADGFIRFPYSYTFGLSLPFRVYEFLYGVFNRGSNSQD